MSGGPDFVEVDPANGTEPYAADGAAAPLYTAPEKIASVVRVVLARPSADPKVGALLAVLTSPLGSRLLVRPMLALLPPMDEPDGWDDWLAVLAGTALELVSDGRELDVDQARADARFILAALFAGESPP